MSPRQRFYLIGQSCIGAAIVNAVINGAMGWAATRELGSFPVWGVPGVVADLAGTAFGVTFVTCLWMAVQVPRDMKRGRIEPLATLPAGVAALLARFPRRTFARGFGLGVLSVPLFAVPVAAAVAALGAASMPCPRYVALKAVLAGVEGGVVTPLLVLAAIGDTAARRGEGGASSGA